MPPRLGGNSSDDTNTVLWVCAVKSPQADLSLSMVNVQSWTGPSALHGPMYQSEKNEFDPFVVRARSVTTVPAVKFAVQVGPQFIPGGSEVIVPKPFSIFVTVSVQVAGVAVGVGVGVCVAVRVGVGVAVRVAVAVAVRVAVVVGVAVRVDMGVDVRVAVDVDVLVRVGVGVDVRV